MTGLQKYVILSPNIGINLFVNFVFVIIIIIIIIIISSSSRPDLSELTYISF